jgi:Fe-S-cluster containining protein
MLRRVSAMDRHFLCTACGKCCFGLVPLTLDEAMAHAGRFPLAMMWTPVRQGLRSYDLALQLGVPVRLGKGARAAVHVVPVSWIPRAFPCPALGAEPADGSGVRLCTVHADKPRRCRTMPFLPFLDERDQAGVLRPQADWACDTSDTAPVVYRDRAIVDRADFDAERAALVEQAAPMRACAGYMLRYTPGLVDSLTRVAANPASGPVVTSMLSFFAATRTPGAAAFAVRQRPVLTEFAARTAGSPELADFHDRYTAWAREMELYDSRAGN